MSLNYTASKLTPTVDTKTMIAPKNIDNSFVAIPFYRLINQVARIAVPVIALFLIFLILKNNTHILVKIPSTLFIIYAGYVGVKVFGYKEKELRTTLALLEEYKNFNPAMKNDVISINEDGVLSYKNGMKSIVFKLEYGPIVGRDTSTEIYTHYENFTSVLRGLSSYPNISLMRLVTDTKNEEKKRLEWARNKADNCTLTNLKEVVNDMYTYIEEMTRDLKIDKEYYILLFDMEIEQEVLTTLEQKLNFFYSGNIETVSIVTDLEEIDSLHSSFFGVTQPKKTRDTVIAFRKFKHIKDVKVTYKDGSIKNLTDLINDEASNDLDAGKEL